MASDLNDENIKILKTFDLEHIPDLDVVVLGALELLQKEKLPNIKLDIYKRPLVVGSGNAEATGRIIFENSYAVFASESNYEEKLKKMKDIDGVVIVSASGEKHAPLIARFAKQYGKHVTLITNSSNSSASLELDHEHEYDEYVLPKNREPYTYNTSTYLGMVLGYTKEDPAQIYRFIQENLDKKLFTNLGKYNKFFLTVPSQFSGVIRMLSVKFVELFGRNIAHDVETSEFVSKHAVNIAKSDELFISFGSPNKDFGQPENRLYIPLPENADYGAMMAIGYYVIGQIEKQEPPYFKEGIVAYAREESKKGNNITPIVE